MQQFRVVDNPTDEVTTQGSYNKLSANDFTMYMEIAVSGAHKRIPQILEHDYCWHSSENKREALMRKEALMIALHMGLPEQVKIHVAQIIYLVTKDMTMRSYSLAAIRLGYSGSLKYEHYPSASTTAYPFRVPITTSRWNNKLIEWVFKPAQLYQGEIPLHALEAMQMLTDESIYPDSFWIADKMEIVMDQRQRSRNVDPILCACFGKWFAGIAMWL